MFSLFKKEIPKARPDEGEGSGGKRTAGDPEKVAKSFADLGKFAGMQDISNKAGNTKNGNFTSQKLAEDVAKKIVSKTNGPTLTKEDLEFINRSNTKRPDTSQKERVTPQKKESTPTDTLNLLKKGDVSVLQQAEGRWQRLSDIKKTIQQTLSSAGYSREEVDRLFAESINPIATNIWEELQDEKDHDRLNTLHQQFVEKTQIFLKKEPQSTAAEKVRNTPKREVIEPQKEEILEVEEKPDVLPQSPLVQKVIDENPQMYGQQGGITVHVGGDFNGPIGHGSSVGGNIEMQKKAGQKTDEHTLQEKPSHDSKKSPSTSQNKVDNVEASILDEKQEKQNKANQVMPPSKEEQEKNKIYKKQTRAIEDFSNNELSQADFAEDDMTAYEAGYRKTQERREYKKGRKKGQEYVVDKWEKNKVDSEEYLSNFLREITNSIEIYRQKLGHGDDSLDKQRGTPRYQALLAVNQMLLDNGKLSTALDEGADEADLQKLQERILKNKQKVEEVLQTPESQWDDIDDLKGVDVYKNMKEQLATAKYDVATLLKNTPEVEDTPEYKVYQQFTEKIQPLMKDEQTMYDSHILVRTTLDSISRQVDAMKEKYASGTGENKDVSVSKEEAKPPQEIINWKIGDKVMIPRTDSSESEAVIQINYLDGTVGVKWEENGKKLSKIVAVKQLKPVVTEGNSSIGEYIKPDESLLQSQEEWRQVLNDVVDEEGDTEVVEEVGSTSDNRLDSQHNQELAKDDPEGLFAWGENQYRLFGMQVPKAGPEGVFSVRAYAQALRLIESRVLPELQKDSEKRKQYNEIIQIVSNVPDSGLTQEEVDRLAVLTQSIAMPESPLHLDTGRAIDQMYTEIEKNVHEKLPALAVKKKKRGFFGRLVRAAVLSLPLIGVASALHEKSPPQKVEAMTTAPTFDTTPTNSENTTNISASDVQDSEISRQIPSGPQAPELGSVASIPMTDVTEMMTSLDTTNDLQEGTQINNETIEKLKDYTVHKGDNLTFIIEGKTEGGIMLPALQAVPEAQREHILNHVITALRYSPEKQKEIGVQSGNVDLIYPGDVVSTKKLNTLITQVAKDQGINVVQQ